MTLTLNNTQYKNSETTIQSGTDQSTGFVIGRVLSINLTDPASMGEILFEPLYGQILANNKAKPMMGNFKHYPVPDEIVYITIGPSYELNDTGTAQSQYYLPPYSLWLSNHQNKFPSQLTLQEATTSKEPDFETVVAGISKSNEIPPTIATKVPGDIQEKANIKALRPFPGDVILESRWGSSMRFGSTNGLNENEWSQNNKEGDPITIISTGHGESGDEPWSLITENISKDNSTIWLTTTQELTVQDIAENFSIESFKKQRGVSTTTLVTFPTLPASYEATSRTQQDRANNNPKKG